MKVSARAWFVIAAIVPSAIVFWANAVFVWNHFVLGPYIHDSGWYSDIVWHNGVFPRNSPLVHPNPEYYGIHVSPLVSLTSVLSYAVPSSFGRIRWYCLFQGAIYAPLGAVVAVLVGKDGRRLVLGDALLVGVVGLLFAFDFQVLACVGFPHFEIFVSTGICIMLAGLATGRTRLAWIGMLLAAGTREDGGFHAASFLAVAFASDVLGRPFPVARRTLVRMAVAAGLASVVAFGVQKAFFTPANLFRHEYLGEPAFGHVTGPVVAKRLRAFFEHAGFISFPLVGTFVVAAARRDARYLLGWVAELPWLLLNFFAYQELKSVFTIYTGFPFVGSMFWVAAYARLDTRDARRRGWLREIAVVSVMSLLGGTFGDLYGVVRFVDLSSVPKRNGAREIERFVDALRKDPHAYGSLYVDPGIASWTMESMPASDQLYDVSMINVFDGKDGVAFFRGAAWQKDIFTFLSRSPFDRCGRIPDSAVFFCTREERTLPPMFVPSSPTTAMFLKSTGAHDEGEGIAVDATTERGHIAVFGPFVTLPAGKYVATWHLAWRSCVQGDGPRVVLDVSAHGRTIANRMVTSETDPLDVPFELREETSNIELRIWAGTCALFLDRVALR